MLVIRAEHFINKVSVHFAHNSGGADSMIQNLTIEEYRVRKQEFIAAAAA